MTKARDLANIISGGFTEADIPNLSTSKITSGTFADARIASSSVTQHVTATDLQPIKSDISALALREATNESSAAFNLPNQFIDTFTDDTNLGTQTTVDRQDGYINSNTAGASLTPTATSQYKGSATSTSDGTSLSIASDTGIMQFGATISTNGVGDATSDYGARIDLGANRTLKSPLKWIFRNKQHPDAGGTNYNAGLVKLNFSTGTSSGFVFDDNSSITPTITGGSAYSGGSFAGGWDNWVTNGYLNLPQNNLSSGDLGVYHITSVGAYGAVDTEYIQYAWSGTATGRYLHIIANTTYAEFGTVKIEDAEGSIITPWTEVSLNATGTLIQSANTVGSAKTKVGGTMLYKDASGTATLGTDLKIYFTCNGGTNWTEASSYSAITPVYSTGIKQVRLGETTCTSGTDVRYKAVWANQASGSKETQLHGIGINY